MHVIDWTATFLDFNPIENVWDELEGRIKKQEEWENLHQETNRNLVMGVSRRMYISIIAKMATLGTKLLVHSENVVVIILITMNIYCFLQEKVIFLKNCEQE